MNLKSFKKAGAVSASVLVLGLAGVTLASAEPTTPNRPYAAVGSDTTQDVWNGLTNSGPLKSVASFNAFGDPATITLPTGKQLTRPNGSGAGVKALSAAHNPANHVYKDSAGTAFTLAPEDIAVARSSSSPSVTGNVLTFLPFARDAVTVAYKDSTATAALNLTTVQVKNIFTCTAGDGVTIDANGKPVFNGLTFTPKLPQAASGTRAFFLKAAGVTVSTTCIPAANQTDPENSGAALVNEGDIIPFSAAQWIAQKNGAMNNTTGAGHLLADIDGLKAVDPTSSGTALKPGSLFGDASVVPSSAVGTFARDVYNVVPTSVQTSTGASDVVLRNTVTVLQKTTAAKSIITKFGFKNIDYVGDWTKGKPSGYTN